MTADETLATWSPALLACKKELLQTGAREELNSLKLSLLYCANANELEESSDTFTGLKMAIDIIELRLSNMEGGAA